AAYGVGIDRVVAAPKASPDRLRAYALPSLARTAEIAVGAPVVHVAVAANAVAAVLEGGVVALVDPALTVEPRRVAVELAITAVFSPDGSLLAVGTEPGRVAIIDVEKGTVARTLLGGRAEVRRIVWSADGSTVAATSAKSALVWPVKGGKAST